MGDAPISLEPDEVDMSDTNRTVEPDYLVSLDKDGPSGRPRVGSSKTGTSTVASAGLGRAGWESPRLEQVSTGGSISLTSSSSSSSLHSYSAVDGIVPLPLGGDAAADGGGSEVRPVKSLVTNNVPSSSHPWPQGLEKDTTTAATRGGRDEHVKSTRPSSSSSSLLPSNTTSTRPPGLPFFFSPSVAPNASPAAASPYPPSHVLYAAATKLRIPYRSGTSTGRRSHKVESSSSPSTAAPNPPPTTSTSSAPLQSTSSSQGSELADNATTASVPLSSRSKSRDPEDQQLESEEAQTTKKADTLEDSTSTSTSTTQPASATVRSETTSPKSPNMPARRSVSRSQRRPSPLDIPVASRHSKGHSAGNQHSLTVVKLEEDEDDDATAFLISSSSSSNNHGQKGQLPSSATSQEASFTATSASSWSAPQSNTYFPKEEGNVEPNPLSNFSASNSPCFTDRLTSAGFARPVSPSTSIDLRSTVTDDEDGSSLSNRGRSSVGEAQFQSQLKVPLRLPRPAQVKDFDAYLHHLELDDALAGVPIGYVLDKIYQEGSVLLSAVVESSIAVPTASPSSSSSPRIPSTIAVRTPASCCQQATPPDYALAVSSEDAKQVMILPVHGLVLASNCQSFAALARSWSVELPVLSPETLGADADDTVRVLPVVHIQLPSSRAFSCLVPFFYTRESGALLSTLLPLRHIIGSSMTALERSPTLLASQLAKIDQRTLIDYVHFNHAIWRTVVALGAGRDDLWHTLSSAWNALVAALAIQSTSSAAAAADAA